jgi:hypothetical protein
MYQSEKIVVILRRLNDTYFLPAIQREFVWKRDQITRLFDSIMQDYPIGSFLFWELDQETRDKWDAYHFLTEFTQGGTHNRQADLVGVRSPVLVLDGQQRLTALLIGLRGKLTLKIKPNLPDEDPSAWADHHLYLDLLNDPTGEPDPKTGYRFRFQFLSKAGLARHSKGRYWLRAGRILDCTSEDELYRLKSAETEAAERLRGALSPRQRGLVDRNLDLLYRRIWREESLAFHLERLQDYDRVLEIFARANDGGTKLDKSDLLLSMVTAKWDHLNAREEIYRLVDRINNGLIRRNHIDKDFVLKCALVLSDLPVAYSAQHFTASNMRLIAAKWDHIRQAIELGFTLVNSFGIDRTNLTSTNAIIPIVYYLMKQPQLTVGGTSVFDVANAKAIHTWLAVALLAQIFGAQSDTILATTRTVIQSEALHAPDFPLRTIAGELGFAPDRLPGVIVNRVQKLTYTSPLTFLALTLLYDDTDWTKYSKDHIFPRSLFSEVQLSAAGIHSSQHSRYLALSESIGNLELLVSGENVTKSNQPFEAWIRSRDPGFKQKHLIPQDNNLYSLQRFLAFVRERETLIMDRLKATFAAP